MNCLDWIVNLLDASIQLTRAMMIPCQIIDIRSKVCTRNLYQIKLKNLIRWEG